MSPLKITNAGCSDAALTSLTNSRSSWLWGCGDLALGRSRLTCGSALMRKVNLDHGLEAAPARPVHKEGDDEGAAHDLDGIPGEEDKAKHGGDQGQQ